MKNIELICASDFEEFFYKDSDDPVEEGDPVGVEWDYYFPAPGKQYLKIVFDLFNNIYWSPKYEGEEI
jgi:hypothetical protein